MATLVYSGNTGGAHTLPDAFTVPLSGNGTASGVINSVVASLYFSTSAYVYYYSVTATLNYTGGSKSVTRTVKMDAETCTGGAFDFTFDGLTVAQANSIKSITVSCAANGTTIYIKKDQYVTVTYSVLSDATPPTSVSLSATNAAPGARVTLSWSGAKAGTNNPIKGYEVHRSTSESSGYTLLTTVSSTSTSGSTTVTAPTSTGYYYYKVKTLGTYSGYDSDLSSVSVRLTCELATAGAPTSLSLDRTNLAPDGKTTLSWSGAKAGASNAITGYEVYRASSASGDYSLLTTVTTTGTAGSVTVTAPSTNGAAYYYKVKTLGTLDGFDSVLSSSYAVLTCSYSSAIAPEVTVNGGASAYALPGETVLLSWTGAAAGANNDIAGYIILRDGVAYVTDLAEDVSSYEVPAHSTAGNVYAYTVVTKGTYANSAASAPAYVYSYSDPAAPSTVSVSNANPGQGARVTLSWSGAKAGSYNAIRGYIVYRSSEVNGETTRIATLYTTETGSTCSVYAPSRAGEAYYYRVETMGTYTNSGPSSVYASVTAGDAAADDSETTVVITPSKREKRGFILGDYDTAAEGWTLCEWTFPSPPPVTSFVTVPGRSAGPLDMTENLTGDPRYDSRPLTARFECSDGTRLERKAIISDMVNRLNGYRREIMFPDDRTRYAVGRLTVTENYNDPAHASVTVTATCEPWLYNREQTVREVTLLESSGAIVLSNSGRKVVSPEVTVIGYDASVLLACNGTSWELSEGTYTLPGLTLPANSNTLMTCTGTGTVTLTYREAIQ